MYAQIIALLFPAYVLGCLLAISLSWSARSFYTSFAYSYALIVFQFMAWGNAVGWGAKTFLFVSIVQSGMALIAAVCKSPSWKTISILSFLAVVLNAVAALAFVNGEPIRAIYFYGMNFIQTLQILSMILASPAALKLYRRIPRQKESPWILRTVTGSGYSPLS